MAEKRRVVQVVNHDRVEHEPFELRQGCDEVDGVDVGSAQTHPVATQFQTPEVGQCCKRAKIMRMLKRVDLQLPQRNQMSKWTDVSDRRGSEQRQVLKSIHTGKDAQVFVVAPLDRQSSKLRLFAQALE